LTIIHKNQRLGVRNKITHQEAFDRLLCRAVMQTLEAERMAA
jgi:hypothetical protein